MIPSLIASSDALCNWIGLDLRKRIFKNSTNKEKAMQVLNRCLNAAETEQPLDLVSGWLKEVLLLLGEISGNRKKEDLYDHIFSQFCIGK